MSIHKTNNNSGSGGVNSYKFTSVTATLVYDLPFKLKETSVVEKNDGDLDEGADKDFTGIGTSQITLTNNPNTGDRFRIIE